MYLYGAGGHAKVVIDILKASGVEPLGVIDDCSESLEFCGLPILHVSEGLSPMIISIGSNTARKRVAERLNTQFVVAVHPSAVISPSARIEDGTVVMPGAIVQAEARIGRHCIVNTAASVDHECRLGDYVHLSPHTTLCGNVEVGEGTWIGAGATVIQGVKIGRWCVIGAGSVVTKDIPDGVLAVGMICKPIKAINMNMLRSVTGGGVDSSSLF